MSKNYEKSWQYMYHWLIFVLHINKWHLKNLTHKVSLPRPAELKTLKFDRWQINTDDFSYIYILRRFHLYTYLLSALLTWRWSNWIRNWFIRHNSFCRIKYSVSCWYCIAVDLMFCLISSGQWLYLDQERHFFFIYRSIFQ